MNYRDCDQFAADMFDTEAELTREEGRCCMFTLSLQRVEKLVAAASRLYRARADFESILERVLDGEILSEIERRGYKKVLGKIFGRRAAARRKMINEVTIQTS